MRILPVLLSLALGLPAAVPLAAQDQAQGRQVTDDTGRSLTIPHDPQRIVVLHEPLLGLPLADLGVVPVGSYGRADDGTSLMAVDFYATVLGPRAPQPAPRGIGAVGEPDLEKLRALRPDLILGTERDQGSASRFSDIAPVYLQNATAGVSHGFAVEEALARLLGHETALAARMAEYQAQLAATRARLPDGGGEGKTWMGVFLSDQISMVSDISGLSQAMHDLGYQRLQVGGAGRASSALVVPVSPEVFGRLNPDLMVVMNTFIGENRGEADIRAAFDRILPGWDQFLAPAREGRMIFVDSAAVSSSSVASAEHALAAVRDWAASR